MFDINNEISKSNTKFVTTWHKQWLDRNMTKINMHCNSNQHKQWNAKIKHQIYSNSKLNLSLFRCVWFYSSFVCRPAYANFYFKTTRTNQKIKIIIMAGVPSSQALLGYLITAPPLQCGFNTKKKKKRKKEGHVTWDWWLGPDPRSSRMGKGRDWWSWPMGLIAKGIPRGCQGLFTPLSLAYPLSVFNKNSILCSHWNRDR